MLRRGIALAITAGSLALTSNQLNTTRVVAPRGGDGGPPQAFYSETSKEYYLTQDEFDFLRPGVHVSIVGVVNVAAGQKPVVEVLFTDDLGAPLDRTGVVTPGAIEAEFVLGQWDAGNYEYVNLTTLAVSPTITYPLHDSGGTWQDIDVGHSKYSFAKAMPTNFDATKTVTLGIYAARSTADIVGKDYVAPAAFKDFRPDGGAATTVFAAIDTASCNNCHDPISMHGQFGPPIQDVKLCVLCHTSQMPITQTGQSLEFKVMIHKIHDGKNLPSVQSGTPYIVSPGADFSTVGFPQDIRNCTTCHTSASADDAAIWTTRPSQAACGACHDNINWKTGANHAGGLQINDASCANCHESEQEAEFDATIPGAHIVEYKSTQLLGLTMTILSVTQTGHGQYPLVTFQVLDKNGNSLDPRPFDTLQFTMGGPTTDYAVLPISENAQAKTTFDGKNATYMFQTPIPATAVGTWAVTCDVELTVPLKRGDGKPDITSFTESPMNPIFYIAITDKQPVPRRVAVDVANCNKCHDHLGAHGGRRLNTQNCIICHNPNNDDSSQRAAAKNPPESISFQRMIHRVHTGENLTQDFTIYGHGHSAVNFNDVRYPSDRRDCLKCHTTTAAYDLPLPVGTIPVTTQRDYMTQQGPGTAACLGCHDNVEAATHASLNTVTKPFFGEACATCHGAGKDWDVVKEHAR